MQFRCGGNLAFKNCRAETLPASGVLELDVDGDRVRVSPPDPSGAGPYPESVPLRFEVLGGEGAGASTRRAKVWEEYRLVLEQALITARKILFKGRSLDSNRFLVANREILLENHDSW